MITTIKCPHCGKPVEISQAFKHQIEEELLASERQKYLKQLSQATKDAKEQAIKKATEEFSLIIKNSQEEMLEAQKRSSKLQTQMFELTKQFRELKQEKENLRLEMEKKLLAEEEKIRLEASKKAVEEQQLKMREKEKQLQDARKANEELRRKLEQGSMQTQGEVLELELENLLKNQFPMDQIKPVAKGVRGADIVHTVHNKFGRGCGSILWELKHTKNWTDEWITKLKDDQRNQKAEWAVIVSVALPPDIKEFGQKDGIYITNRKSAVGLAIVLREFLILLNSSRLANVGKKEKMDIIFNYLSGTEFKLRVEAIIEAFSEMQTELEKEKRWFVTKWARQEKNIRKVIDQTHGMYGDLQSIMGASLPQIKSLELPEGDDS